MSAALIAALRDCVTLLAALQVSLHHRRDVVEAAQAALAAAEKSPGENARAHADRICAAAPQPAPLTDERIDFIAETIVKGMPEGVQGFCKSWGWRHFARALLEDCAGHYRARQPLTDEQIDDLRFTIKSEHHTDHARQLVRLVERAHGIGSKA